MHSWNICPSINICEGSVFILQGVIYPEHITTLWCDVSRRHSFFQRRNLWSFGAVCTQFYSQGRCEVPNVAGVCTTLRLLWHSREHAVPCTNFTITELWANGYIIVCSFLLFSVTFQRHSPYLLQLVNVNKVAVEPIPGLQFQNHSACSSRTHWKHFVTFACMKIFVWSLPVYILYIE